MTAPPARSLGRPGDLAPIDPDRRADWDALAADYAAGAAAGFADRVRGAEPDMVPPFDRDPWRTAWQRGFLDGWIGAGHDPRVWRRERSDAAGGAATTAGEETGDG